MVPRHPTRGVCCTKTPPSPCRAVPGCAQTVPFGEIREQTLLCPHHARLGEPVLSGAGAVPTGDLPWGVPGGSRVWALLFPASLVWVMSGFAVWLLLFLTLLRETCAPREQGWGSSQAFSHLWAGGRWQGAVRPSRSFQDSILGVAPSTSTAWNVQQLCLSLLASSGCPAKALCWSQANSPLPVLSPLSVPLSPALLRGW